VRVSVRENGAVRVSSPAFAEVAVDDLPFVVRRGEARAKVYDSCIVVLLPIGDATLNGPDEVTSVPVASCSGPVEEVVSAENCLLEAEVSAAAGGASEDWLKEASYRALYQMIADKPVSTVVRPIVAPVKSAPKVPKRNDPCFCGSGRKFKNCHMK
jgi:hypothetical protein